MARLFAPEISLAAVSQWRNVGIPPARRQTLSLLAPQLFGKPNLESATWSETASRAASKAA